MTNTQRNARDESYDVDFDAIDERIERIEREYIERERTRDAIALIERARAYARDTYAQTRIDTYA